MAKKNASLVHFGKRSWWNGKVTTACGLVFESDNQKQENSWTTSVTCPACKTAKR